jgi:hypothetical protein
MARDGSGPFDPGGRTPGGRIRPTRRRDLLADDPDDLLADDLLDDPVPDWPAPGAAAPAGGPPTWSPPATPHRTEPAAPAPPRAPEPSPITWNQAPASATPTAPPAPVAPAPEPSPISWNQAPAPTAPTPTRTPETSPIRNEAPAAPVPAPAARPGPLEWPSPGAAPAAPPTPAGPPGTVPPLPTDWAPPGQAPRRPADWPAPEPGPASWSPPGPDPLGALSWTTPPAGAPGNSTGPTIATGTATPHAATPGGTGGGKKGRRLLAVVGVIVLIVGVGALAAGFTGRGPLRTLKRSAANRTAEGDRPTSSAPPVVAPSYHTGECVVWDPTAAVVSDTKVVPCEAEHLIEITGGVDLKELPAEYPAPGRWSAIISERCAPLADAAYGAKLDPDGRFTPGAIRPVEAGWLQGDRQLWCGIEANWINGPASGATAADQATAFTGAAKGQPQFWTYKAGDCLDGTSKNPVACTAPHELEVVGEITLPPRATVPDVSDTKAWGAMAGTPCDKLARTYLGKAPKAPWESSYIAITEDSWKAGKRNVTCVVGSATPGGWATVSTPAKSPAR